MDRPTDETQLVARARRGDADAFEELVRMHQTTAFRLAYLLTGSAGEAEEATQDALLKAHRALGRFREGAPFRPWLLRIVANEAHNRRRSARRRAELVLRAPATPAEDASPSPEATLLAAERRRRLLDALDTLREEERLVVACRYLLELSEEETAVALGIRRGTAKSRLSRGLVGLRVQLGEGGA